LKVIIFPEFLSSATQSTAGLPEDRPRYVMGIGCVHMSIDLMLFHVGLHRCSAFGIHVVCKLSNVVHALAASHLSLQVAQPEL